MITRRREEVLCVLNEDCFEWLDVETVEEESVASALESDPNSATAPIISDVSSWMTEGFPFVPVTDEL